MASIDAASPPDVLLERRAQLEQIRQAHEAALADGGQLVLVSGEAGIGKTSLIEAFVASLPDTTRVYWGGCEALFAARPLGPLFDIAGQLGGRLLDMLKADEDNHGIYSEFLSAIGADDLAGSVFVVEDIHWADNATMDFLKFVGRRIRHSRCLIVVSYRDDEIGPSHPLHHVIGELPGNATIRLRLAALSIESIAELGHCGTRRAGEIHAVTGGNPFFVRELLSSRGTGVPVSITDAILAKASRLGEDARLLLNLVSVVPARCELSILESAFPNALSLLDECGDQGLLTADRGYAAFRHELARLAVEDALPAGQRNRWNAHVLSELRTTSPDAYARLAHHADMAGDREAVLQFAPAAARHAARLGAHLEAVALYRQALSRAEKLGDAERAGLLESLAYELYVTGRIDDAIATHLQCLELWRRTENRQHEAASFRWLSRLHWFAGKRAVADRYAEAALKSSETLADRHEYAMACSNRAQLYMLSSEAAPAVEWANRAIELAEAEGDLETLVHALNNLGTAISLAQPGDGTSHLQRSLELSLESELQEHVARAYTNLASVTVSAKQYAEAGRHLEAGLAYTADRDLDSWLYYMQGWRARLRLETGDWNGAADDAMAVARGYRKSALVASPALTALARLRLRRGDPDSEAAFEQAYAAIAESRELQRLGPMMAAKAERCWLMDSRMEDLDRLVETRDWAQRLGDRWMLGELCWWLRKLGVDAEVPDGLPGPHDLLLRGGDWAGAAAAWADLGCPYESALALAEGDEDAQREALRLFSELGAEPAAARLRRNLRARGVRDLPKKARRSTLRNPAGLTNRQMAVLGALAEGLTNAEIAGRLFISPRTVDHHVSAILGKLEVQSRTEAAIAAQRLGIGTEKHARK